MVDEEILRKKTKGYVVCYSSKCPQREHCLRWQAAHRVKPDERIVTCINLLRPDTTNGSCQDYRDNKPVRIPKGMIHFYDNMPGKLEREIKSSLIARFTRVGYYKLRNGERQITPQIEREIAEICLEHGWSQPLVFDEYTEELLW